MSKVEFGTSRCKRGNFVRALCSDFVLNLVTKIHTDYDHLLQDLLATSRVKTNRCYERIEKTVRRGGTRWQNVESKVDEKRERPVMASGETNNNSNLNNQPKCYRCGDSGHMSRNCQYASPVCYICKKQGHIAPRCSQGKPSVVKTHPEAEIKIVENGESTGTKFIHNVIVNDRYLLKGFVDTGSSVCTIRSATVKELNLNILPERRSLYGYGEREQASVYTSGKLMAKMSINNVVADEVELLVVPDTAQETDLLIGRTYKELKHIAYVRKNDKFIRLCRKVSI